MTCTEDQGIGAISLRVGVWVGVLRKVNSSVGEVCQIFSGTIKTAKIILVVLAKAKIIGM